MPQLTKTTHKLYNGTVKINFDPLSKRGRYVVEGLKQKPESVSEITGIIDKSYALMPWASRIMKQFGYEYLHSLKKKKFTRQEVFELIDLLVAQPENQKVTAGKIGTASHDWFHNFALAKIKKKKPPPLPTNKSERQCVSAFLDWYLQTKKINFEEAERVIFSKKYRYVGTLDTIVRMNGIMTLCDYKTSNTLNPGFLLQLCGYWHAYNEENPRKKIKGAVLLHFDRTEGKLREIYITEQDFKQLFQIFLYALRLTRGIKKARHVISNSAKLYDKKKMEEVAKGGAKDRKYAGI